MLTLTDSDLHYRPELVRRAMLAETSGTVCRVRQHAVQWRFHAGGCPVASSIGMLRPHSARDGRFGASDEGVRENVTDTATRPQGTHFTNGAPN